MANIRDYLNNIINAVFGKDVRQSIHDSIEEINNEIETNTIKQNLLEQKYDEQIRELANEEPQLPEIVDARCGQETLGLLLKKKVYHFETVQAMKKCLNLAAGDVVQTLGYYEANDGGAGEYKIVNDNTLIDDGGSIHNLSNGLKAILVINNDTINVKQFGTKGDGTTDDSLLIQKALDKFKIIKIPSGDYLINNTLIMKFNTNLIGINPTNTRFIVGNNLTNSPVIKYGQSYDYSGKRGTIKNIAITSNDNSGAGIGLVLYSGITIFNVTFNKLKVAINRASSYIDQIELINCGVGYCTGTEDLYAVNLSGNGDELKIDCLTIQSAYTNSNFNEKCGILVSKCSGGYLKNSIINAPLLIHTIKAFSIENSHFEGSQGSNYYGNKSFIELQNSNVSINNCYLHKRVDGGNIVILSTSNENSASVIELNNIDFIINHNNFEALRDNFVNYEIEKNTKSILKISNVGITTDFSSNWTYTHERVGIKIKDIPEFNVNSSYYSINSVVGSDNRIVTSIPQLFDIYSDGNFLTYSNSNNKIPFLQEGLNNASQYIRGIVVFDENRKLAVKKSNMKTITGVTSGIEGSGILVNMSSNNSIDISGKGLILWYYRGDNGNSYNRLTKIPVMVGQNCFDSGLFVSGCQTEQRAAGDIDEFNYVKKCSRNGENVTFYSSSLPTVGSFVKGDKCINSNISGGNVKSWVYNGIEWISEGTY